MEPERRAHPRKRAATSVTFQASDGTPLRGWLVGISRGGCFVGSPSVPTFGEPVELEMRVASKLIKAKGRVVWTREKTERDRPAGMGVEFTEISEESLAVIDGLADESKLSRPKTVIGIAPAPRASSPAYNPPATQPADPTPAAAPEPVTAPEPETAPDPETAPAPEPETAAEPVAPEPVTSNESRPPPKRRSATTWAVLGLATVISVAALFLMVRLVRSALNRGSVPDAASTVSVVPEAAALAVASVEPTASTTAEPPTVSADVPEPRVPEAGVHDAGVHDAGVDGGHKKPTKKPPPKHHH